MGMIKKLLVVTGTLETVTGVHIGADGGTGRIGGCDNPVIKDSITGLPYIPGSSLKGKMRCSLEQVLGKGTDGKPCNCDESGCIICKIFGNMKQPKKDDIKEGNTAGLARLIISDMKINEAFIKELLEKGLTLDRITEIKTETAVDRRTGKAIGSTLRNFERVVPGIKFDVKFIIRILDKDNEGDIIDTIKEGIKLVNDTGIGAKTTSGSGQVKIALDWDKATNIIGMEESENKKEA